MSMIVALTLSFDKLVVTDGENFTESLQSVLALM